MNSHDLAPLIDRYAPALILYARQWCETAEDVVQEAFVSLAGQAEVPRDVTGWLYRVVRNRSIDAARGRRRRQRREAAVARTARWFVEPEVDDLDAATAVTALQGLPLEEREIIVAHLWGGLSFEQAGALAGCSASTAFRRYSAGIEVLRRKLGVPCPVHSKNA